MYCNLLTVSVLFLQCNDNKVESNVIMYIYCVTLTPTRVHVFQLCGEKQKIKIKLTSDIKLFHIFITVSDMFYLLTCVCHQLRPLEQKKKKNFL